MFFTSKSSLRYKIQKIIPMLWCLIQRHRWNFLSKFESFSFCQSISKEMLSINTLLFLQGNTKHPGLCPPCQEHHKQTRGKPEADKESSSQGKLGHCFCFYNNYMNYFYCHFSVDVQVQTWFFSPVKIMHLKFCFVTITFFNEKVSRLEIMFTKTDMFMCAVYLNCEPGEM